MLTREAFFIPGAAGQGSFWSPVAGRLPETWRTRLLDLPGLGSIPAHPDVASYDDLVEFLASRMMAPAVLVAQSMGCYIALQIALRYPDRVSHLVLAALTGGVDVSVHGGADWRADYAETFPTAQPWARAPVSDLSGELHRISVPVLLFWATRDPLSPLSVAHTLQSKLSRSSLITFDTDDHWVAREHPDETATTILHVAR